MIKSFLEGILAAAFAFLGESLIMAVFQPELSDRYFSRITFLLILAVVIEEILKYWAVSRNHFPEKTRLINVAAAFFVGLGFSLLEVLLVFFNKDLAGSALLGGIAGLIFIHILTASLAGFFLFRKKSGPGMIIFFNCLLHLAYNWLVIKNWLF